MSLLETNRARVLVACPLVLAAAVAVVTIGDFGGFHILAAKRAQAAQDVNAAAHLATPVVQHPNANAVLVELFTSEGCSDCPPADALLARLQHDQPVPAANIIALEEHVDYWDQLGWRDPASPRTTSPRAKTHTPSACISTTTTRRR